MDLNQATTARSILDLLLAEWHALLRRWTATGELVAAAREALQLPEIPGPLNELVEQWQAGDFKALPSIVPLPATSMVGAAGTYAIGTGTIYLNRDWLASAPRDRVLAVLTEELGHHLDGLLNAVDTPGDEGELFALLLHGDKPIREAQRQALLTQDDHGSILLAGESLAVERAALEDGTPSRSGSEFLVNTTTNSTQKEPTITGLADGRFVVAWSDLSLSGGDTSFEAIRAQVFNSDGSRAGSEFLVNTTTSDYQYEPTITGLADGRFVVAWRDGSQSGGDTSSGAIRAQVFSSNGTRTGTEFLVNTTSSSTQYQPTIAGLSDGRFVVAWSDFSQSGGDTSSAAIRAQVFNSSGSRAGGELLVNTTTSGFQTEPTITGLADGRFVIAWTDESQTAGDTSGGAIRAQIFNSTGSPAGAEVLVNTTVTSSQYQPTITGLAGGRFVVAWRDGSLSGGDRSGDAIRAQVFHADGSRAGAEVLVNTTVTSSQYQPTVAGLADGRFVVAWSDSSRSGGDTSLDAIRAQVFDSDGSRTGLEVLVNTTTTSTQYQPTVAGLVDGRFVVAWTDSSRSGGDTSSEAIRAQVFDPRIELPQITLAVSPTSVTEDGASNLVYTFSRTGATSAALTVNYTAGGSASAGSDYSGSTTSGSTGTVTFAAGAATATVVIDPSADTTVENDETIDLTLAAGSGYTLGTTTAVTGTISNDDLPVITLAVSPDAVREDGITSLVYTFSRTGPTSGALTVIYTIDGSATAGSDYSGITTSGSTGTVTFAAGAATATVVIDPSADTTVENDETIDLTLAAGSGYTLGDTLYVSGSIINDDDVPSGWGSEFLVNTTTTGRQYQPTIAGLADGRFVVAWSDFSRSVGDTSLDAIRAQVFDSDGTRAGAEFLVNTTIRFSQDQPTIAGLSDGRFVVAWRDLSQIGGDTSDSAIRAQMFLANGTRAGAEFLVNTTTRLAQDQPTIAGLGDGRFVVAWRDLSQIGGDTSNSAIRAQVFLADGTRAGVELLVNTSTSQSEPTIAGLSDSRFMVAWVEDGRTWRAEMFEADGSRAGGSFIAGDFDSNRNGPTITGLADGRFVAAWSEDFKDWNRGGIRTYEVHAQVFERNGDQAGAPFRVNTTDLFDHYGPTFEPTITGLADGRFVVAWRDDSQSGGDTSGSAIRAQVFDSDGTRAGAEFLVNTTITNGQYQPTTTGLADGRFVVAWTDSSESGGDTSFEAIRAQVLDPSTILPRISLAEPSAAVREDGTNTLPFTFTRTGPTTGALTVSYTVGGTATAGSDYSGIDTSGSSGTVSFAAGAATATVVIDPSADTSVEDDETIILSLAPGPGYVVGATAAVSGSIINDDDVPSGWGSEFLVNTTTTGVQRDPTIAGLADGRFVVAWTDFSQSGGDTSDSAIRAQVFLANGTRAGAEFLVNTTTNGNQFQPTITGLADGRFVIAWTDESQTAGGTSGAIRAQVFLADGTRTGAEFLVNTTITNGQSQPMITGLADGRFLVAWRDTRGVNETTRGQIFHADGSRAGSEFLVTQYVQPTITGLSDGRFVVAWEEGPYSRRSIWAKTFNSDGSLAGEDFIVSTNVSDTEPTITSLADGRFVIAWRTTTSTVGSPAAIRARVFQSNGTPASAEFLVKTTTNNRQDQAKITGLADGRFVVAWRDDSQSGGDTSGSAIRAQVFDSDGTRAGAEFLVNTTIRFSQDQPTIAGLSDGRFVVTWTDSSESGGNTSESSIRAQVFDPSTILPQVSLAGSTTAILEDGATNLLYTFSRTGPTTGALTVSYTIGGTAIPGSDYSGIDTSGSSGTVTFAAGAATATVVIDPSADTSVEDDETVVLSLDPGPGYVIGTTAAVIGTISNDDVANSAPTSLSVSASSFDENIAAGSSVASLATSDPDSGNTFTYALVSGDGDSDNAAFSISGHQLLINASPNFEAWSSYRIRIRSTDQGGLSIERSIGFAVNNLNEAPTVQTVDIPATLSGTHLVLENTDPAEVTVNLQGSPDLIEIKSKDVTATLNAISTQNWTSGYFAYNVGSPTKPGTGESISLDGIGKYSFVATAIPEATSRIVLQSDKNTAFFLEDAYSAFYSGLTLSTDSTGRQSTKRMLDIDTIVMASAGGSSIVDLTSKDYITGGVTVYGANRGRSVFWGSDADDTFIGDNSESVIYGGAGHNRLNLGDGADTLQYRSGVCAVDMISNFNPEQDNLQLWSGRDEIIFEPTFDHADTTTTVSWAGNMLTFLGMTNLSLDNLRLHYSTALI